MAESHVLSALKDKRALVAGEIIASERRIGELRAALVHLDGAMRLFAGNDINPEAIPARLPKPAGLPLALPRGDMSRAVLEALRGATGGLSLQSATHMVATALGLNALEKKAMNALTERVRNALYRQRDRGVLESHRDGGLIIWRAAD